jgi:hypothetical protein
MTDQAGQRTASGEVAAGPPSPSMLVLVPLMLVSFVYTLDQTIVATTLPSIGTSTACRRRHGWPVPTC